MIEGRENFGRERIVFPGLGKTDDGSLGEKERNGVCKTVIECQ